MYEYTIIYDHIFHWNIREMTAKQCLHPNRIGGSDMCRSYIRLIGYPVGLSSRFWRSYRPNTVLRVLCRQKSASEFGQDLMVIFEVVFKQQSFITACHIMSWIVTLVSTPLCPWFEYVFAPLAHGCH